MTWVTIRSRRDPAFWAPILVSVLVCVPLGLLAHAQTSAFLRAVRELAASDPEAALAEAIWMLRAGAWVLTVVTSALCACLLRFFQLGRREQRLPPSGWWSLGAYRAVVGDTARRMSGAGFVVSALVLVASIGLALSVEHLIRLMEEGKLAG